MNNEAGVDPKFSSISVGGSHACGVKTDGATYCWGQNVGQATPPSDLSLESVVAGVLHSCGLKPNGTAVCWGSLENAGLPSLNVPGELVFTKFISLSARGTAVCGVKTDNSAVCWGWFWNNETNSYDDPTPPDESFAMVSVGLDYACGVTTDGRLSCWGDPSELDSEDYGAAVPKAASEVSFATVSAGFYDSCAVTTEGAVLCWGEDYGEGVVPHGGSFISVSIGSLQACGLKSDATLACWWHDDLTEAPVPEGQFLSVAVSSSRNSYDKGSGNVCALRTDGTAVCWGRGWVGPSPGGSFTSLDMGIRDSICAVQNDGTATCWNYIRNPAYKPNPTPPAGTSFVSASPGEDHVCGIRSGGSSIQCWGGNSYGEADPPLGGLPIGQFRPRICLRPEDRRRSGLLGI